MCPRCISKIDEDALPLVLALNKLPGIRTYESCCGHGMERFLVWLRARTPRHIAVIADCLASCEWPHGERWTIAPWRDVPDVYLLQSTDIGPGVVGQSRLLCRHLLG